MKHSQISSEVSSETQSTPETVADGKALLKLACKKDGRLLIYSGLIASIADLIWIPQAAILAWTLGSYVDHAATVTAELPIAAAIGFVVLAVLRAVLGQVAGSLAQHGTRRIKLQLRNRILNGLIKAAPGERLPSSGEVAAVVSEHIEAIGPYARRFLPLNMQLTLVPLGLLIATACVSWLAAIILIIAGPLIPLFMALVGMKAKEASDEQQEELVRLSGFVLDRIRGLETLRLFGALKRTEDQISDVGDRFRVATMRVLKIAFLSSTVLELFSALGIALVAVYIGFSLLGVITIGKWGGPMTLSTGLFVLLMAPDFFSPLRAFAAAYHDRASALAAADHMAKLPLGSDETPVPAVSLKNGATGAVGRKHAPEIRFESVSLTLGEQQVLRDVTFIAGAGERLFLSGQSGAGKTTLLDCVLGLNPPGEGSILVDGAELGLLDLGQWRQQLSWISQEPRLFYGSVQANLLRANPQATEAEIYEALELAGARSLIERLPRGLQTQLGENGFGLSVGEARRIALARAALRKDAGLLLADEPTAGLDDETAKRVVHGLEVLSEGRTVIISTHDPLMLKMRGRVLQVSAGTVRDEAEGDIK